MTEFLSATLWNTEWTKPGTAPASVVSSLLHSRDPEIICVTEGYRNLLSPTGHIITSAEDHGYGTTLWMSPANNSTAGWISIADCTLWSQLVGTDAGWPGYSSGFAALYPNLL